MSVTDAGGRPLACRECGSTSIEYVLPDFEGGNRYRHTICMDCGSLHYSDDYLAYDGGRHHLAMIPVVEPMTMPPLPQIRCSRVVLVPRTVIDAVVDMYLAARTMQDLPPTMVVLDQPSGRAGLVGGDRAEAISEGGEFPDYPQFLDWADNLANSAAHDGCPAFPFALHLPGAPDAVALKQGFGAAYRWTPNRRAALLELRQLVDPAATLDEDTEDEWWPSGQYIARMGEIDPAALAAYAARWAPHAAEVFMTRAEIAALVCDWLYWMAGDVPGAHCVFEGVGRAFWRYEALIDTDMLARRRVCSTCGAPVDPDDEDAIIMPVDTPTGRVQRRFCGDECLALHIDTATPMEEA